MNDVVVENLKKSKNLKIIKHKEIKNEVLMNRHQIRTNINHRLVKVNRDSSILNYYRIFLVLSPSKKKKKTTNSVIPKHGTIDSFFKKTNSSTDIKQSEPKKIIDTTSQKQSSTDNEVQLNYTKCPICQVLLPKANLFIHQVRCYK